MEPAEWTDLDGSCYLLFSTMLSHDLLNLGGVGVGKFLAEI